MKKLTQINHYLTTYPEQGKKIKGGQIIKAARLFEYGEPLRIVDTDIPEPRGQQVLIKVCGTGVCRTDFYIRQGTLRDVMPIEPPLTLGHEVAGIIHDVGNYVKGFKKGDPILVCGVIPCDTCKFCRVGQENVCVNLRMIGETTGLNGGYAEYMLVPNYRQLIKAEGISDLRSAAALTDAGLTSYHAIRTKILPKLSPDSYVAVVGIGGLGHVAVQLLKSLTKATLIAVDRNNAKLDLAAKFGAEYVINPLEVDVNREIRRITNGKGVDVVLELAGSDESLKMAMSMLGQCGRIVIVGFGGYLHYYSSKGSVSEIEVVGSNYGSARELEELVALYKKGALNFKINFRKLEEVNEVLDDLGKGAILGRTVITP